MPALGQATYDLARKPATRASSELSHPCTGRSAPADLKKDANGFDLPIALGLLLASGQVAFDRPGNYAIVGELALTGETRPIKGILSMALQRWRVINRRTLTTGDRMGIWIEGESSWNSSRSRDLPGLPPLPSAALMG